MYDISLDHVLKKFLLYDLGIGIVTVLYTIQMFSIGCIQYTKSPVTGDFEKCVEGGLRSHDLRVMSAVLLPAELPRQMSARET